MDKKPPIPVPAPAQKAFKIRLGIGVKLISILGFLIFASIASVVWIATQMFTQDNMALIQQMSSDTAISLSSSTRSYLESTTDKILALGKLLDEAKKKNNGETPRAGIEKSKDIVRVEVLRWKADTAQFEESVVDYASEEFQTKPDFVSQLLKEEWSAGVSQGMVRAAPFSLDSKLYFLVVLPYLQVDGGDTYVISAWLKPDVLLAALSQFETYSSFIVDKNGTLMAHIESSKVLAKESKTYLPLVQKALEGNQSNGQMSFWDPQFGAQYLGAFSSVGFSGWTLVTQVPEDLALAASVRVRYRSLLVAVVVLAFAFLMGYYYSQTITWPVELLSTAAAEIAKGNFRIHLKPQAKDELGHLATSFNQMAKDLEHREKVVSTFHKFHNKEIADKLLSGEVKIGGERKQSVVFFSDLRGFTAMSEAMEPEQVVEMLNMYLSKMVTIIRNNKGIVDKFIGDAIMALWGVPNESPDDAENALKACLEMRAELGRMNEERLARGQDALKIGIGLHCGPLIAGNIGSTEKMEYTVIGDTVNLSSRIESLTKHYGTDLLVSSSLQEQLKDKFIFEECDSAKVKGKSSSVIVYKVRGYKNADGTETIVETPYSNYQAEKSDKVLSDFPEIDEDKSRAA